ncbi:glycosyltransferase [Patescibacteria group bacterium]
MKKLKIALIGLIARPTSPRTPGGTEIFNYNLFTELTKRSYDITLFASKESEVDGKLFPIIDKALTNNSDISENSRRGTISEFCAYAKAFEYISKHNFDIIHHSHFNLLPIYMGYKLNLKQICNIHIHPKNALYIQCLEELMGENLNKLNFVSVSKAQQKMNKKIQYCANIYHGIDTQQYKYNKANSEENYFLFIGRFTKQKGIDLAIKSILHLNKKLKIISTIPELEKDFFRQHKKYLDQKNIYFFENSQINHHKKIQMYQNAKALLFPITLDEPFGLVMIEAMACGTPVIAFDRGAISEVIKDGKTGFIVKDKEGLNGLTKAIKKIQNMPEPEYQKMRENCRKHAEDNFSIQKMVDGYEKVYKRIAKK